MNAPTDIRTDARAEPWSRYALFSAVIAAAGLPLYIHAPKFFADVYGAPLAAIGATLFVLRLIDFVQDPLLGRLTDGGWISRRGLAAMGLLGIAAGMVLLFAVRAPIDPVAWMAIGATILFTSFSLLTILFYAQGVAVLKGAPDEAHLTLAAWREAGALLGVSVACALPALVGALVWPEGGFGGYAALAWTVAALALAAGVLMNSRWIDAPAPAEEGIGVIVGDGRLRGLLVVGLLNAAPLAVTATLFLFYVESVLQVADLAGPLLLLFFIAAAAAAPFWSRAARRWGARPVIATAMVLAIVSFIGAFLLGPGDAALFAVICVASGAALGADLTLLPAMFAQRLAVVAPQGGQGFGLWSFCAKFTLAIAAGALLPLLQASGFESGETNNPEALFTLAALYALLPCGLKLFALAALYAVPDPEKST